MSVRSTILKIVLPFVIIGAGVAAHAAVSALTRIRHPNTGE